MPTSVPDEHSPRIETPLARFLTAFDPVADERTVWHDGTVPLLVKLYLTERVPLQGLITSVRCVLFRDDEVMVLRDEDGTYHVSPGGQREVGETLAQTLRRELLEETGWLPGMPRQIGFLHFHHQGAEPPGWSYLYPDFFQIVYAAEAADHLPEKQLSGSYELTSGFSPIVEASNLPLGAIQRRLLEAACRTRSGV